MYINQLQGVGFAGILATIRAKAAEKRLAPPRTRLGSKCGGTNAETRSLALSLALFFSLP